MQRYNVFGQGLEVEAPCGKYIKYKDHIEENANLRTELAQVKREVLDVTKSKDYYYKQLEIFVKDSNTLRFQLHKLKKFMFTWFLVGNIILFGSLIYGAYKGLL
jgi:hypothetical protein